MPSLAQLINQVSDAVQFGNATVRYAYSQDRLSYADVTNIQALLKKANSEPDAVNQADYAAVLAAMLVSWDLTENDGTPVSLTVERLTQETPRDAVVPAALQLAIVQKLVDALPTAAAPDTPAPHEVNNSSENATS